MVGAQRVCFSAAVGKNSRLQAARFPALLFDIFVNPSDTVFPAFWRGCGLTPCRLFLKIIVSNIFDAIIVGRFELSIRITLH